MSTEKLTYSRVWTDAEAFPRLGFTKNWENPEDYPTIETDEQKVRQDMQSLHDETKAYINETLIPAILAADAVEAARITAEQARESNELARVQAEQTRVTNEEARSQAEAARDAAEKQRQASISGQVATATEKASSAAKSATEAEQAKTDAANLVAQAQQAVENAATVEIGTVTEGDTMSVTNVGTKRAAKLDFVLRRGEKGDKGDKGDPGAAGADGKTAYAYAQEGGYTGTEDEFKAKLAAEYAEVDLSNVDLNALHDKVRGVGFSPLVFPIAFSGADFTLRLPNVTDLGELGSSLFLAAPASLVSIGRANPTLNVNDLGAVPIQRFSGGLFDGAEITEDGWFENGDLLLMWYTAGDEDTDPRWTALNLFRLDPAAGGTGAKTAADARTNLGCAAADLSDVSDATFVGKALNNSFSFFPTMASLESSDGVTFTATVPGLTSLATFTAELRGIATVYGSTTTTPTLNINGLGAYPMKPYNGSYLAGGTPSSADWLEQGVPYSMLFNGGEWLVFKYQYTV